MTTQITREEALALLKSLFFTAGNYRNNPNLDANGTAV